MNHVSRHRKKRGTQQKLGWKCCSRIMTTLLGSYAPHWDRYSDHQCSRHKTLSRLALSPSYFNIRSIIIFLRVKSVWAVLVCSPISCICVSVILGRPEMADLSPHRVKQSNSETKLFWFPLHPPYTNNLQRRWKKLQRLDRLSWNKQYFYGMLPRVSCNNIWILCDHILPSHAAVNTRNLLKQV